MERHGRLLVLLCVVGGCSESREGTLFTQDPLPPAPASALEGTGQEACALYQQQTCSAGILRECSTYNVRTQKFLTPDPLTHRALLYERWHDLYFTPDGQAVKRTATEVLPAGATEEEWSSMANFDHHEQGLPDSMIWTGTGLLSYMLRYLVTGAEVDYQRIEQKTRQLLTMFDITGIPGFAPRGYYYVVPDEAPKTQTHAVFHQSQVDGFGSPHWSKNLADLSNAPDLHDTYRSGYVDSNGTTWKGTTRWFGSPTIDMYSGVMTSLPAAWGLLRDEALKARIVRHMSCYLKRLRRYEIINIQSNPEGVNVLKSFMESGDVQLDPGDPVLTELDRIVFYVLEQPNELNADTFDRSCPESIATEPSRVLDMKDDKFLLQLLPFAKDLDGKREYTARGVDHFYIPNLRGADAIHMMHLAAMLYHMTGDVSYRRFLEVELVEKLNTLDVAKTWAAFIPPKWCRKWYTEHISFPPMWAFANLLEDSPLKDDLLEIIYEEVWLKDASHLLNAKFALLYGGVVPEGVGTGQQAAMDEAVQLLREFGGNGGVLDAPRRNYPLAYEDVVSQMPAGITAECPSEETVAKCETGAVLFGIPLAAKKISAPCTGAPNECVMASGECVEKRASSALPPMLREQWGYQWQGDPYQLGSAQDGLVQGAGLDLFEPYWTARYYHAIPEAEGVVLAWKEVGPCP